MSEQTSLCKQCKHRFRRVFVPAKEEKFYDESGQAVLMDDEHVLIIQTCLASDMDLEGGEVTIECNHFEPKVEDDRELNIFKHLK